MTGKDNALAGFTLVELLIVVVIVGVLASVTLALYNEATTSAYLSEADAALGSIRGRMRNVLLFQEGKSDWEALADKYTPGLSLQVIDIPELQVDPADLDGRFFDHHAYRLQALTSATYTIYAVGDSSTAPGKDAVAAVIRSIDQEGNLVTVANVSPKGGGKKGGKRDGKKGGGKKGNK